MTQAPDQLCDTELIDVDLVCVGCGYNLRTLGRSADCPECNTPVASSFFLPGFRVTRRRARRIWRGLLLLVLVALCAGVIIDLMVFAFRHLHVLEEAGFTSVVMGAWRIVSRFPLLLLMVAAVLIARRGGELFSRRQRMLGIVAVLGASLLLLASVADAVCTEFFSQSYFVFVANEPIVCSIVVGLPVLESMSLIAVWVLLAQAVDPMSNRGLRLLSWVVVVIISVKFLAALTETLELSLGIGGFFMTPVHGLLPWAEWWNYHAAVYAWIVRLVVIGFYARRLNAAFRLDVGSSGSL